MLSRALIIRQIRLNLDMRPEDDLGRRVLLLDKGDQRRQLRVIDDNDTIIFEDRRVMPVCFPVCTSPSLKVLALGGTEGLVVL